MAGFLFIFLRHLVDGFNIMTTHRKEMESKSAVFKNIMFTAQLCLMIYQLSMLAFFTSNGFGAEAFCVTMIVAITVIFFCIFNKDMFTPETVDEIKMVD